MLDSGDYADFYQVRVKAGTPFVVETYTGGTFDPYLSLYTTDSFGVMSNDDGGTGLEARLDIANPTTDQLYYIAIHRFSGNQIRDCEGNSLTFSVPDGGDKQICSLQVNNSPGVPPSLLLTPPPPPCRMMQPAEWLTSFELPLAMSRARTV
jgi:hypothetical protein